MESFGTANGWVAVLISLGAAVFLPLLSMGITAFCLPRTTVQNSEVHWAERARRLYPFKAVRIISISVLPVLYATGANFYPDTMVPIPKWIFGSLIFLASFGSTNWTIWWLGRRYHLVPEPFWERLRNIPARIFLYAPIFLFAITAAILPDEWNWQCAAAICAGLVAYFWLHFDNLVRVGRWLGFLRPADLKLSEMARELAHHWQRPEPTVWLFFLDNANAWALPAARVILVTEKARTLFSSDEMQAVLAHELAHLYEDRVTRLIRLLTPLLYLPLIKLLYEVVANPERGLPLLIWYPVIMVGFVFLNQRRRRMEIRADVFGSWLHEDKSIYARALAKLYRANELPAVMSRKRLVHPHLYDRLRAGVLECWSTAPIRNSSPRTRGWECFHFSPIFSLRPWPTKLKRESEEVGFA
jgi:Zn-dependent protease with chaperone function